MGNCIQSSSAASGSGSRHGAGSGGEGALPVVQLQRRRSEGVETMEDQGAPSSVVKVKMVLTKGELGWLVARLKAGDRLLEDALHEMARSKKRDEVRVTGGVDGWRPSLESIVECPAETAAADTVD